MLVTFRGLRVKLRKKAKLFEVVVLLNGIFSCSPNGKQLLIEYSAQGLPSDVTQVYYLEWRVNIHKRKVNGSQPEV